MLAFLLAALWSLVDAQDASKIVSPLALDNVIVKCPDGLYLSMVSSAGQLYPICSADLNDNGVPAAFRLGSTFSADPDNAFGAGQPTAAQLTSAGCFHFAYLGQSPRYLTTAHGQSNTEGTLNLVTNDYAPGGQPYYNFETAFTFYIQADGGFKIQAPQFNGGKISDGPDTGYWTVANDGSIITSSTTTESRAAVFYLELAPSNADGGASTAVQQRGSSFKTNAPFMLSEQQGSSTQYWAWDGMNNRYFQTSNPSAASVFTALDSPLHSGLYELYDRSLQSYVNFVASPISASSSSLARSTESILIVLQDGRVAIQTQAKSPAYVQPAEDGSFVPTSTSPYGFGVIYVSDSSTHSSSAPSSASMPASTSVPASSLSTQSVPVSTQDSSSSGLTPSSSLSNTEVPGLLSSASPSISSTATISSPGSSQHFSSDGQDSSPASTFTTVPTTQAPVNPTPMSVSGSAPPDSSMTNDPANSISRTRGIDSASSSQPSNSEEPASAASTDVSTSTTSVTPTLSSLAASSTESAPASISASKSSQVSPSTPTSTTVGPALNLYGSDSNGLTYPIFATSNGLLQTNNQDYEKTEDEAFVFHYDQERAILVHGSNLVGYDKSALADGTRLILVVQQTMQRRAADVTTAGFQYDPAAGVLMQPPDTTFYLDQYGLLSLVNSSSPTPQNAAVVLVAMDAPRIQEASNSSSSTTNSANTVTSTMMPQNSAASSSTPLPFANTTSAASSILNSAISTTTTSQSRQITFSSLVSPATTAPATSNTQGPGARISSTSATMPTSLPVGTNGGAGVNAGSTTTSTVVPTYSCTGCQLSTTAVTSSAAGLSPVVVVQVITLQYFQACAQCPLQIITAGDQAVTSTLAYPGANAAVTFAASEIGQACTTGSINSQSTIFGYRCAAPSGLSAGTNSAGTGATPVSIGQTAQAPASDNNAVTGSSPISTILTTASAASASAPESPKVSSIPQGSRSAGPKIMHDWAWLTGSFVLTLL
ncbi:hypothetical protein PYCC9005_005694 [Savitreella phatthalungensis]